MLEKKKINLDRQGEFKAVFEAFYGAVVRHLLYLLGDQQAAEDVAQEVFLRLHHVGLENVEYPKTWLLKVASNRAYNYLNSEKARRQREQKSYQAEEANVIPIDRMFLLKEEVRQVHQAIDKLPERDRMALLLKSSDHSYREIADALDIPANTVGTVLARAKKKLIAELEREYAGHRNKRLDEKFQRGGGLPGD